MEQDLLKKEMKHYKIEFDAGASAKNNFKSWQPYLATESDLTLQKECPICWLKQVSLQTVGTCRFIQQYKRLYVKSFL